jgi:hypothetical protein
MNYTRTTPKGIEVSDAQIFSIRLFVLSESKGECNLPVDSVLTLVDIINEAKEKGLLKCA